FKKENSKYEVRTNYDSSGTLAQQINAAGGADIFISASKGSMDKVEPALAAGTRFDMLENKLTAIVPLNALQPQFNGKDEAENVKILINWISKGAMVSIGNYEGSSPVPAGEYAYNLLNSYDDKLFSSLKAKGKLNLAQNVTAVLAQVAANAADIGFVYSTDAATRPNDVKVIITLTPLKKIVYPAAILSQAKDNKGAAAFFEYLKSDKAKSIFTKYGFKTVD
ncbi:MAG: molybdate ABC transporter substrate-binding protein, partial [Endomicrobium sp.]|nr:molybdate ABC transporter substrate-binding protein [Endomicrobium sp.]